MFKSGLRLAGRNLLKIYNSGNLTSNGKLKINQKYNSGNLTSNARKVKKYIKIK